MINDKKRRHNSTHELSALTDSVTLQSKVSFSKNSTICGNNLRENAWEKVAAAVSAVGGGRNVEEVKKKWTCLKSDAKHRAAGVTKSPSKTGGGPPDKEGLSNVENKIFSIIGNDSIRGIRGDIDSTDFESTIDGK